MTDSLWVALVGAGSALIGGLIAGYFSTRVAIKQIKAEVSMRRHDEKVAAYTALLSAYHNFLFAVRLKGRVQTHVSEGDAFNEFNTAYSIAMIHAPDSIATELRDLYDFVTRYASGAVSASEVGTKYLVVETSLRRDVSASTEKSILQRLFRSRKQ